MRLKGYLYKYILIALTAVGITFAAVINCSPIYRVIPLYISLLVMYLQTKASRNSFLLGGCNAAYYGVVYAALGLYGMAMYNAFFACPIQIITFFRWKKHTYANNTILKRLSNKQRFLCLVGFSAGWAVMYFALKAIGSEYIILDNSVTLISVCANIASLLYLIEFPYIQCVSYIANIVLYIQMIRDDPRQWPFLIYAVYALICVVISAVYMQKLYNFQNKEE